ncbi:MAG: hypothetical protein CMG74_05505 [Candidatus Marinimicrobia bacterium]|nr:hypothetical protein [Candidatus Neomarinimicrobiota bacterium]|tara:strand:- start:25786 stop:26817 length:1032 start_codon:yes stop_codon:yes gene_type:complete
MSDSRLNIESVVARIITDKPVRKTPYQVKGVFIRQYSDEPSIPMLDGTFRDKYLYPRVQVKILNEQIYITGLNEGVKPVLSLIEKLNVLDFGNITFQIKNKDVEMDDNQFLITDRLIRYKFITPWVALNKMTGGKYKFLTNQEKPSFLNRLLGQNIVFIAKEVGINLTEKVFTKVKMSSLFPKPVDDNKWGAFMGEFKTNFVLPNYIGVGNGITRGYGAIYGMFNPEIFLFDENKLKKEKSETSIEQVAKKDNLIDSIDANDIPKPKRRKRKPKKTNNWGKKSFSRKKPNKKKPRHRNSVFTEEFDNVNISERGNMINESDNQDSQDDSKYNTEKHHKKQHKF